MMKKSEKVVDGQLVLLETINNCYRAPLQIYPTFVSDGGLEWNISGAGRARSSTHEYGLPLNGGPRGHRPRLNAAGKSAKDGGGGEEEEEEKEKEEDKGMVRQNIEVAF